MLRGRGRARLYQIWPDAKLRAGRKGGRSGLPWGTATLIVAGIFIGGTAATILTAQPESDLGQSRSKFITRLKTSWPTHTAIAANSARSFSFCFTGGGSNCVVDGDTFWFDGIKIRIADIDAPETHPPRCPYEADLGNRATNRLHALLNAGPIQLEALPGRDEDRYGRKLRIVLRDGQSLGGQLVGEGLARAWKGHREPWC
jgi:micrococcal nuclease